MTTERTPGALGSHEQLGPLPEAAHRGPTGTGSYFDAYTAEQMRSYAAEQVAAERERCAKTPLTDEQVAEACGWKAGLGCIPLPRELRIARAIERAHGIGPNDEAEPAPTARGKL